MNNFTNNEQNNKYNTDLRDNFKNIQEDDSRDTQEKYNRDLRDNFKNIQEFMNAQHYNTNVQ